MQHRQVALAAVLPVLASCAGPVTYTRPSAQYPIHNSVVIAQPRAEVWKGAIRKLDRRMFVIYDLDQASGLLNLSYSGDPEQYVDCGRVTSYVKHARSERKYMFRGAAANVEYEVMSAQGLFQVNRRMKLDGRINVTFEDVDGTSTRVTANTRYGVEREVNARNMEGRSSQLRHSIVFNTGGSASFPAPSGQESDAVECKATGKLESDLIRLLQ